jgi:hypothetical protein
LFACSYSPTMDIAAIKVVFDLLNNSLCCM